MKIRAIQFSPILGNIKKNLLFHKNKISQAIKDNIDLIVFPELSISGYQLKDLAYDTAITKDSKTLQELKALSKKIDIVVGLPYEEIPGIIYNSSLYLSSGEVLHNHKKVQLPNFGIFEEAMIFKAGYQFKSFKVKDFTVGLLICREILFPVYTYLYYLQNCDFIIAISNSPFRGLTKKDFSSFKLWENLGYIFSVFYHQNYLFVNRCGFEEGIGFGGGSFFAAPGEGIITRAKYFEPDYFDQTIDLDNVRKARIMGNYLRDEKPTLVFDELKRILTAKNGL